MNVSEVQHTDKIPLLKEKVVINFSPVWCTIETDNSQELHALLYDKLAYKVEGFFYSAKYQCGTWDGYSRLYKPTTHKFRIGMLPRVVDLLQQAQCYIELENFPNIQNNKLERFVYKNAENIDIILRDYQINAANEALKVKYGIIQAPPRSGKTVITAAIIEHNGEYPVNFFIRSKDLAYQTKKVFDNNFKSVGFICDGICEIGDVNIITIQSAYSAFNKKYIDKTIPEEQEVTKKLEVRNLIKIAKGVFGDEIHHIGSATGRFIFDRCLSANMKIGLSATPFSDKAESILVEETVGPVIFQISYSELIKAGYLMKPYIYLYKLPKKNLEGVYRSIYKQAVIEDEFINKLIKGLVNILNSKNKSIVIQTEYVQHSKDLAKYLGCDYLTGNDSTERRNEIKTKLNNKEILCLVSTLYEEGIDSPSLDYTMNLVGGLDSIGVFQKMRSITAHESKTTVGIIDFIHQCKYLKRHSKRRLDLYNSEPEFVVTIRDVSKKSIEEIFNK